MDTAMSKQVLILNIKKTGEGTVKQRTKWTVDLIQKEEKMGRANKQPANWPIPQYSLPNMPYLNGPKSKT